MLRAIEYRICPTEEPKVLLAGTSGCCRFAYKRALHMKITACKERKLPFCPRHCHVGLAKGAITIPKAMYKAGKSGHKPSATGKQGGLMDAVSWEVGNCAEQSLPDGFHTGDKLHAAGSPQQMTHHGFGGIDLQVICMFSKCQLDRSGLEQVIMMGAGSMGINIGKLFRCHPAVF